MPLETGSDIGPLISERQGQTIEDKVRKAISEYSRLVYSGIVPNSLGNGRLYPPTVLLTDDNASDIVL